MDEARLKEVEVKYGLRLQIADQALRDREVRLKENASKIDRCANPLTVGIIVGALGLVGNFINGLWANVNQGKQLENQRVTEKIKLQNDLIKEAIKPPTEEERAKSLVFFATNRLIDLDPEVLKELIARAGSDKPVPGSSSPSGVPASVNHPDYNLALPPDDPSQTRAARRRLGVAVSEIDRNVDEGVAAERILQYWRSTSPNVTDVRAPWSAAFLSSSSASLETRISPWQRRTSRYGMTRWQRSSPFFPAKRPRCPEISSYSTVAGRRRSMSCVQERYRTCRRDRESCIRPIRTSSPVSKEMSVTPFGFVIICSLTGLSAIRLPD
jgi:hypothetical protein